MKTFHYLLAGVLLFPIIISARVLENQGNKSFNGQSYPIPLKIQERMKRYTWHLGCPVSLKNLRYVKITYWGFDKKTHRGSLIVNKALAKETIQIFKALYLHKFPIERMELIDEFQGKDDASMAANNTSSFNCRSLTGHPEMFSQHSYGRAIDINPKINPYVSEKITLPPNGSKFADRNKYYAGKITKDSFIYKLFTQHGWDWGGNWHDIQDYQHFEKRTNGEKRNPQGYK